MRTTLVMLIATGMLVGIAAPALAQAPDGAGDRPSADERRANATARYQALVAARHAALDSFHENRTRIHDEYNASLHAIKASFLEDKAAAVEACQALRNSTDDKNATKNCVRDAVKPLIEKARADIKAAREKAHADLQAAREASMGSFRTARADADARYGRPSS